MWPFDTKASEPLNDLSNTRSLIGVKGHSGTSSICTSVQAEELKELLMDEKLMKNLTWLKILFHFPTDCCQSHLFKVCSNVGQFLKWGTDTMDQLSTWAYTYPSVIKKSKNWYLVYNHGSLIFFQKPKSCLFFDENQWFFEVFEIIMITDSLILNFFQRSRTGNSRIFKELKLVVLWKFKELLNTGVQLDHQAKNNVISCQFFF